MILARTSAQLPLKFPLELPAGLFDLVEPPDAWQDNKSAATEDRDGQHGQPRRRNSQVEIHTLGAWTIKLDAVATFLGTVQDERQFFSQLPNMPTIPFRLKKGGLGLINTVNIVRASAWPKPEMLPGIALPFAWTDGLRPDKQTECQHLNAQLKARTTARRVGEPYPG